MLKFTHMTAMSLVVTAAFACGSAVASTTFGIEKDAPRYTSIQLAQRSCRTVSEMVICSNDCRQVPRASGDGKTRVFVNVCTPRYCSRQRQVCN